ncbi:hypothetical protein PIB30_002194 [Stylosanthes scabra]|uniref:RRM domain-containing protein n=1 Tax=Stylosanthes scabra TaxID=79078 RepID=A0ABU6S2S4_9FABA|nr:hypothetical protein [Stylosanthes scabra]
MSNAPSSKLYIGGVSHSNDEQSLRQVFGKYDDVVDARIIVDRDSGRSRGFGIVTYRSVEEASSAIRALNGQDLYGRRVRVNSVGERPRGFRAGADSGYQGGYANPPYGASSGGGGGSYGGNCSGSEMNNANDNSFASEGYGDNSGNGGRNDDIGNYGAYGGYAGYVRDPDCPEHNPKVVKLGMESVEERGTIVVMAKLGMESVEERVKLAMMGLTRMLVMAVVLLMLFGKEF